MLTWATQLHNMQILPKKKEKEKKRDFAQSLIRGGTTLFSWGSNEPPDLKKKKLYIYIYIIFFFTIIFS